MVSVCECVSLAAIDLCRKRVHVLPMRTSYRTEMHATVETFKRLARTFLIK